MTPKSQPLSTFTRYVKVQPFRAQPSLRHTARPRPEANHDTNTKHPAPTTPNTSSGRHLRITDTPKKDTGLRKMAFAALACQVRVLMNVLVHATGL
eukprot:806119-Alexandrium_andersonii.AAC.1